MAYLWPGLPHLWVRGSLSGLVLALAFSVLLNVLVLGTLVWPAWLESRLKFSCGAAALVLWVAALWETRGELRRLAAEREDLDAQHPPTDDQPNDRLLGEAQMHYLRGDWTRAEKLLREATRRDRDDFEARFWLVSVLRSSGRTSQAERLLRRVERLDAAGPWRHEIEDEHTRITEASLPTTASTDESPVLLPINTETQTSEPDRRAA